MIFKANKFDNLFQFGILYNKIINLSLNFILALISFDE